MGEWKNGQWIGGAWPQTSPSAATVRTPERRRARPAVETPDPILTCARCGLYAAAVYMEKSGAGNTTCRSVTRCRERRNA